MERTAQKELRLPRSFEPLTSDEIKTIERRRRFIKYAAGVVALNWIGRMGFRELTTALPSSPDYPQPRTLEELQFIVRREMNVPIGEPIVPSQEWDGPESGSITDLPAMIGNGFGRANDAGFANIPGHAREFFTYYGEDRLPDPSRIRCNNHAYGACRSFSQYGMPMHLLAIAPPLRHLLDVDWHVMAVCPLHSRSDDARAHLVFDNGTALLWRHGGLASFVAWSERNVPMEERRRIPSYGIARYREPKHPSTHRLLMHLAHAVEERGMQVLELQALTPAGHESGVIV
ncbi:MAG: hypothetical protein PHX87_01895 [Candidatus Peribacteraceae bacterium]|nr:hypothetical protein [Candidatus Peribacteraceae bacterium]MDD5742159.1 hypothetical protein [Candidatus Peribacteraceae bacterium]